MTIQSDILDRLPECKEVNLYSDMSSSQAALVWLHRNLLKKWQGTGMTRVAKSNGLSKFISNNDKCVWAPDETSYYHEIVMLGRSILLNELTSDPVYRWSVSLRSALDHMLPGPGASLGTKQTDFLSKLFLSKLTTYDANTWRYYSQSLGSTWGEAESLRLTEFGPATVVDGTKLNFADKETGEARVINTEASIDMMFQKGLGADIEDVLKRFYNIDLSTQPTVNRFLAKMGSLGWMKYATMDLKSFSDTISKDFVQFYLPPPVFKTLSCVRATHITLPREFGGEKIELKMFSTMGNGFTFPLQTLILASLIKAVYVADGLPSNCHDAPHFSVFGDDVIVLERVFHKVAKVLEYCGFTVNEQKSFSTGCFRESCGEDYFKGQNIRSVYLRKFSNDTDTYSLFNRLVRWSCRNNIDVGCVLEHLFSISSRKLVVPLDAADTAGFKLPYAIARPTSNRHGLAQYTELVPVASRVNYRGSDARLLVTALGGYAEGGTKTSMLGKHGRLARGVVLDKDGFCTRLIPPGGGDIVNVPSTMRRTATGSPQYRLKRGSTSSWDFVPFKRLTSARILLCLSGLSLQS